MIVKIVNASNWEEEYRKMHAEVEYRSTRHRGIHLRMSDYENAAFRDRARGLGMTPEKLAADVIKDYMGRDRGKD